MRILATVICIILFSSSVIGQSSESDEIVREGTTLYRTEMASWYGTDIFLAKFGDRRPNTAGYFSYVEGEKAVCVFFSKGERPKIIGTFAFDSTYDVNTASVDGQEREPTARELDLIQIRQTALAEYKRDTLFKSYKGMNPNFIPLSDEKGKRVYVLTGPEQHGVVIFGNDYVLKFDNYNRLVEKRRIHNNIITVDYGRNEGKVVLSTMHTHLPGTGDLITATDVCTLMLYSKYAKWGQHFVLSGANVSIWDCKKNELLVLTREAFERINANQNDDKR